MWPNEQETAHLVTFTEEILNGNLRFLRSVQYRNFNKIQPYSILAVSGVNKKIILFE